MVNLNDILANAQGGDALDQFARQYNLTPQQTDAAVDALLPAFSIALKQAASSPDGLARLFQLMTQSNYQSAFDDPSTAFGGQGRQTGNQALDALFGSPDVSRAVAQQASQFAGVGPDIIKRMLPIIAAMLIGGLFKSGTQGGGSSAGTGGGGLGDILGSILGQLGGVGGGGGGFPGGQRAPAPQQAPQPQQQDPQQVPDIGDILGQILGGVLGGGVARGGMPDGSDTNTPQPGSQRGSTPGLDELSELTKKLDARGVSGQALFGEMFDSGRNVQQDHVDNLQKVFESFLGGGRRG